MNNKRNIVMIGAYPPTCSGGIATHVYNLSKESSKHYAVTVITLGKEKNYWREGQVQVYQEKLLYPYMYSTLQTIVQTTKRAFLLRKKVDLYHAHGAVFSGIGFLDKKKPLVLTIHGYASLEAVANGRIKPNSAQFKLIRWVERKGVERADAIIAIGTQVRDWIINELDAEPRKIFCIPNGVDVANFFPFEAHNIKRNLGFSEPDKVIIFIKAFNEQSGIRDLIRAFPFISEMHPRVKLLAIGGGILKQELEGFIKTQNLDGVIKLMDRVPYRDVPKYINVADVFILPSTVIYGGVSETFGISLIEAMACEKPVIATSVGGPKEIIEEGGKQMRNRVGILIPPEDSEAIAKAIIYLLDHPTEAKEMGQRARDYILKNYLWDRVVEKTLQVYEYALGKR